MVTLTIGADLDHDAEAEVVEKVRALVAEHSPDMTIHLDLSSVTFFDSSGIRTLVRAQRLVNASGHAFVLTVPEEPVRRRMRLAGIDDSFTYKA